MTNRRCSTVHTVYLINSAGGRIDRILDVSNVIKFYDQVISGTKLLSRIETYEDTTFPSKEMPEFLSEWQLLVDTVTDDEDRAFVARVREMAERSQADPGSRLLFEGD